VLQYLKTAIELHKRWQARLIYSTCDELGFNGILYTMTIKTSRRKVQFNME